MMLSGERGSVHVITQQIYPRITFIKKRYSFWLYLFQIILFVHTRIFNEMNFEIFLKSEDMLFP